MNIKFFENVLKYGSVLVGCAVVGIISRKIYIDSGGDDYTGTAIMWAVVSVLFIVYSGIMIILNEVSDSVIKNKRAKKIAEINEIEESPVISEQINFDHSVEILETEEIPKPEEILELPMEEPLIKIEEIRTVKAEALSKVAEEKKNIALSYTREEFALYLSNANLDSLCESVSVYAVNGDFENLKSVLINGLTSLDLFHFGWNLWNHFRIRDQRETAVFLKTVFPETLKDIEVESIKKHLKDDERKGIIKIKKDLTQSDNNQ